MYNYLTATKHTQLRPGDDKRRVDELLKENPLDDFWKKQWPCGWHWEHSTSLKDGLHLHGMFAGRFLSFLGTDADCERLFSAAKHHIDETRCRLDPETASDLIFCSENLELLSKDSRCSFYCDSLGNDQYEDGIDLLSKPRGESRVLLSQNLAPQSAASKSANSTARASVSGSL